MTTIHSIVEPRKHVRVIAIGDGDVALDIGRPGRPAVSLAAIRVPVADLRAALDEVAPAGSYTRTDEDTPEQYREAWQAAEKAVLDERAMRKDAEQERDAAQAEAAMCQTSLAGQIRRAEQAEDALVEMTAHRDQCRDTAIRWQMEANRAVQPRALTPDAITDAMVERAIDVADRYDGVAINPRIMRAALTAALTEPPRPEGAEEIEAIIADQIGGDVGPATIRDLADRIATEVQP